MSSTSRLVASCPGHARARGHGLPGPGRAAKSVSPSVERDILRDEPTNLRRTPARDSGTGCPALLVVDRGVFEVVALGVTPPVLPPLADAISFVEVPETTLRGSACERPSEARMAAIGQFMRAFNAYAGARSAYARKMIERDDPVELLNLSYALGLLGQRAASSEFEKCAFKANPDHPLVRWTRASAQAGRGRWEKVVEHLRGIDLERLDNGAARHVAHMMGLALLHAGEHEEARNVLVEGLPFPGDCPLNALLAIACPLEEGTELLLDGPVRDLVRRVATADERLSAGDPEGAVVLLDDVLVWEAGEVQSMARFARGLLDLASGATADRRCRTLFVLAAFLRIHETKGHARIELFVRGRWSTEQLDALSAEAQAWIDRQLGD